MKLLIVDDEKITRDGIMTSIEWTQFPFTKILLAENGLTGLELASKYKPEIILSDIRMPRMNGIDMAKEIHKTSPNCIIIFMSGYSDKEYLKAAIKLRALSYIEKPLDPTEIEAALHEAIRESANDSFQQSTITHNPIVDTSQLALYFTYPKSDVNNSILKQLKSLGIPLDNYDYLTTFIIKFDSPITDSNMIEFHIALENLSQYIHNLNLFEIHAIKHETHLIYHVLDKNTTRSTTLQKIANCFLQKFIALGNFFVIIGKTVHGIHQAYSSYSNAVILSQRSFFYTYFSIIVENEKRPITSNVTYTNRTLHFQEALLSLNQENVMKELDLIVNSFTEVTYLLPTEIKDYYYQLFLTIQETYNFFYLNLNISQTDENSIMSYIEPCANLYQLHEKLEQKTTQFFADYENHKPENSLIFSIKDFISRNYQNESLSVKDISKYVNLSTSYVCTLFKAETEQTINQYLTEFRIGKAKKLLADPRYKITDISSKVGYSDGNYFSKAFKKIVGSSPSEYRGKTQL